MKAAVIYFSQTGNTQKVAGKIRDGILEKIGRCDLFEMAAVDVNALAEYDLVGLGCPVFYFKEPFNVREFLEALPLQHNKHWFVFCSHGAVMGETLISMADGLEGKGAIVIGSHHTYADITVPFYPRPTLTSGHPDDQDLKEAFEFGKKVIRCSKAVSSGDLGCISKPAPIPEDWAINEAALLTRSFLSQVMPVLSINQETCVQCGECQNDCPVRGIDIESDPPRIQKPCIYCFHCASICPTCAIEADWSALDNMAPVNYARYRKALDAAEGRREFRWLIDPDAVDCSDPLHKQRERDLKK